MRSGPRPWSIRAFAAIFVVAALASFADGMVRAASGDLPRQAHDAEIIGASVRLTIALMTAGFVWVYAARFARWLVPLAVAAKLVATLGVAAVDGSVPPLSPLWLVAMALGIAAAILLFAPASRKWFAREQETAIDART